MSVLGLFVLGLAWKVAGNGVWGQHMLPSSIKCVLGSASAACVCVCLLDVPLDMPLCLAQGIGGSCLCNECCLLRTPVCAFSFRPPHQTCTTRSAGAQIDAFLSMAHLAASMSSPDISMPLLVVAAAQFALFAGADMTLLLHVWRAHDHHHEQQQRYQRQGIAADGGSQPARLPRVAAGQAAAAGAGSTGGSAAAGGSSGAAAGTAAGSVGSRSGSSGGAGARVSGAGGGTAAAGAAADGMSVLASQWMSAGSHMGSYRPAGFVAVALPLVLVVAASRSTLARLRQGLSASAGAAGGAGGARSGAAPASLLDAMVVGVVQLLTGRSLLMLYVRFYMVLLAGERSAAACTDWTLVSGSLFLCPLRLQGAGL